MTSLLPHCGLLLQVCFFNAYFICRICDDLFVILIVFVLCFQSYCFIIMLSCICLYTLFLHAIFWGPRLLMAFIFFIYWLCGTGLFEVLQLGAFLFCYLLSGRMLTLSFLLCFGSVYYRLKRNSSHLLLLPLCCLLYFHFFLSSFSWNVLFLQGSKCAQFSRILTCFMQWWIDVYVLWCFWNNKRLVYSSLMFSIFFFLAVNKMMMHRMMEYSKLCWWIKEKWSMLFHLSSIEEVPRNDKC